MGRRHVVQASTAFQERHCYVWVSHKLSLISFAIVSPHDVLSQGQSIDSWTPRQMYPNFKVLTEQSKRKAQASSTSLSVGSFICFIALGRAHASGKMFSFAYHVCVSDKISLLAH